MEQTAIDTEVWIGVRKAAELMNCTPQYIRLMCKERKFTTRPKYGNGGMQYEIALSSMPEEAIHKYYEEILPDKDERVLENEDVNVRMEIYNQLPEWQRNEVDKWIGLFDETAGMCGAALKDLLRLKSGIRGLSYGNYMKKLKAYRADGITALIPGYGKNLGSSIIDDEDFEYFKALYLKQGGPGSLSAWVTTKGFNMRRNLGEIPENFPSESTFMARLYREIPKSAIYKARKGDSRWNRKFNSYCDRDYSNVRAGQVWVSDHRQMDIAVFDDSDFARRKGKKAYFPWVTVWRDFKTGKWLGWYVHTEDPCADHIFQAFFNAVRNNNDELPEEIYIDNGKDYRCKDFAGTKRVFKLQVDEDKTRSMLAKLHIIVHFAQAYNGQSKPVERDFKFLKDWFDKSMPGYRGGNHVERPEVLAHEIKSGGIIKITEYIELFDYFIHNIVHTIPSEGKVLQGRTREQVWNEEYKSLVRISPDSLKLFCMRSSDTLTIGRDGIVVNRRNDIYYWADWMIPLKGSRVYMRRDPHKYQEAWIFSEKSDEFLGVAYLNAWRTPALAKTDLEKAMLAKVLRMKDHGEAITDGYIPNKRVHPQQMLEDMAAGVATLSDYTPEQKEIDRNAIITKTSMDDVMHLNQRMQQTGTDGDLLSQIAPKGKNKPQIFTFESEVKGFDIKDFENVSKK